MNDVLRSRTFAKVKEGMAVGLLSDATSAAMVPEIYQQPKDAGGRDMDAAEAHRIVSLVAMGKACNLFRHGNMPKEREVAIDYLTCMVKNSKLASGSSRWRLSIHLCRCVAAVAVDELCWGVCPTCKGARVVPMSMTEIQGIQPMIGCPTCHGDGKRRHWENERLDALRVAWNAARIHVSRGVFRDTFNPASLSKRRRDLLEAVEWAKSKLLEAERVATEETIAMVERW
jgi:hypothetical protein